MLVTYQVGRTPDGKMHQVAVTSKRAGVTIKAPKFVYSGTSTSESEARARWVLEGQRVPGELALGLVLSTEGSPNLERAKGFLEVRTELRSIVPVLERLGKARLRVTLAVEIPGSEPFVIHDEKEVPAGSGTVWTYEVPIEWPRKARRVSVVVDELQTGAFGTALEDLPQL